uniref:Uncharacterized protein n=1 Tax=Rhizophora mucronata TaxID=61149 RepID=A0A2P2NV98_RHIMU
MFQQIHSSCCLFTLCTLSVPIVPAVCFLFVAFVVPFILFHVSPNFCFGI